MLRDTCKCPRDWAAQVANIVFWREHDQGGHFSSLERPEQYLQDIWEFVATERVQKACSRVLNTEDTPMRPI